MGLPSLYESGPEEEEIFGLTRPMDDLPDGTSDDIATEEQTHMESSGYQSNQDEEDERLAGERRLARLAQQLDGEEYIKAVRFIEEMIGSRGPNDRLPPSNGE